MCCMGSLVWGDTLTVEGDLEVEGHVTVGSSTTGTGVTIHGETGGSASPSLTVKGDGNVLFEEATGTSKNRFEWVSKYNMFLSGKGNEFFEWGGEWGNGSVIFGDNNIFSDAHYMLSIGDSNYLKSINNSLNIGDSNYLEEINNSLDIGDSNFSWANRYSLNIGPYYSGAFVYYSINFGHTNSSEHSSYTLLGGVNNDLLHAEGIMVLGKDNIGNFLNSGLLVGDNLYSEASYCYILGRFNSEEHVGDGSLNWVETDPLFILANGTGDSNDPVEERYRNAFTVYKNGDVEMTAKVRMPAQGDILMGEFGNQNP